MHYDWIDNLINSCPRYETGFTQLLACEPYCVKPDIFNSYQKRLCCIKEFQNISLEIFKESLKKKGDPLILKWLLNDTPSSIGFSYHTQLDLHHFTSPIFFRTDEAEIGKIVEIQCPGSLWGELQIAYDYIYRINKNLDLPLSPSISFVKQLNSLINKTPIIHHLLDNASVPSTMRYFIEKTRSGVKYFGIDPNIYPRDCNFIRSHSFFGLCAENEFKNRIKKMIDRMVIYDLPPHVLFDQKATLILPFWSKTRCCFTDEIRNLFVYTTPLLPKGIELEDGSIISIESFSNKQRNERSYYLKYAGSDVSMNWGSKAVYRLSNMNSKQCLHYLQKGIKDFEKGRIWILQKDIKHDDEISYFDRDQNLCKERLRAKFSAFYGPYNCLGIIAMHRNFYKVHGQPETVISLMIETQKKTKIVI